MLLQSKYRSTKDDSIMSDNTKAKGTLNYQRHQPTHILVWNWDLQQWEIWEEKALWKILQRCRRVNTAWSDIE